MKYAAVLATLALALVGCSQKQAPAPGEAGQKPGEPPPQFVTAVAENQPAENVTGVVDVFLTQQLQAFIQQKQRLPEDFAELARTRLDSVPRPPEGKKWVIDKTTRQVKAVANQ
jgi:PBP1b-binding outer membrane lipoprotein LpoB